MSQTLKRRESKKMQQSSQITLNMSENHEISSLIKQKKIKQEFIKEEIEKLFKISVICASNSLVINYINKMFDQFIKIIIFLFPKTESDKTSIYDNFLVGINNGVGGAISIEDMEDMIHHGNIREKMTFMYNLAINQCMNNLYNSILLIKYSGNKSKYIKFMKEFNINDETINKTAIYICSLFNISLDNFKTFFVNKEISEINNIKYCNTYTSPLSDIVKITRSDGAPIFAKFRTKREQQKHVLKIKDIYPKLSVNEIKFIKKTDPLFDAENIDSELPWETGYKLFKVKEDNFIFKLSQLKYKNFFISGFSGSADVLFQMFELFNDNNIDLSIMACIAYMGNSLDHSLYEILMVANSHSDKQYDLIDVDVYLEVDKIIASNTKK